MDFYNLERRKEIIISSTSFLILTSIVLISVSSFNLYIFRVVLSLLRGSPFSLRALSGTWAWHISQEVFISGLSELLLFHRLFLVAISFLFI